jgi:hypothetical protein
MNGGNIDLKNLVFELQKQVESLKNDNLLFREEIKSLKEKG